ncbi:hypothetical protein AJ85_06155 [Alkalihalobacillus alcalophilus ATCC 27647 = CGMCC 1.3604]|uniref:Uncharacterized protein n=2 Tax=Alkalihalobacillus alcalophilus ATCC 27647 = CGMCC 1.3604 TaxID=1218173 RepID=A0A4V3X8R5_ALKAL|nr:hypothetical protein [Alkalihalobacillus alcalophilus]MED1561575.1 hypothetical protein [Alkalihalobacillus alcalophilus]THG91242.1 hypothetical protein AJ85_06155 [Alkalihalobacillus alcalophilus ATCC 27647 = CGMCC 1.3604]
MDRKPKLAIWILVLFFLVVLFIPITFANAEGEESLHIETNVGFEGKISRGGGFPLELTLTNQGEDLSGELVIRTSPTYNTYGNLIFPLDIPAGETRTLLVTIPGYDSSYYYGQNQPSDISFYESGWSKGKEIKITGKKTITGQQLTDDATVMGILSNDPDSLNSLKSMTVSPSVTKPQFVNVDPKMIPEDYIGLTMLDYLLLDQFSLADLTDRQQQAIESWIQFGGQLIVGGDPAIVQKSGLLKDALPMGAMISTVRADASLFKQFNEEESYPEENVALYIGEVEEGGQVNYTSAENYPVAVQKRYGSGEIIQLAFSPSESAFINWEGNTDVWKSLFNQALVQRNHQYNSSIYDKLNYTMTEVNNIFANSTIPFGILVAVFFGYVLLIFPLLFIFLKKLDKREYAWWILPSLSIVIAIGLFGFGAKDRIGQPQLNEFSVMKLQPNKQAYGFASFALFSNNSGDYMLSINEETFAGFPYSTNQYSYRGGYEQAGQDVLYKNAGQLDVLFEDVEYWAVRNVTGPIEKDAQMALTHDLVVVDKEVSGTIKNDTGYQIEELFFKTGNTEVSLGPVAIGETIEVSFEAKNQIFATPTSNYYHQTNVDDDLDSYRKDSLMKAASENGLFDQGLPAFIAITNDSIFDVEIKGKPSKKSSYHLLVQSAHIEREMSESFDIELNEIRPDVYMESGYSYLDTYPLEEGENFFYADAGTIMVDYQLPHEIFNENVQYTDLKITVKNQVSYEIWNEESGDYESLENGTEFDNPERYINGNGHLLFRITKADMPHDVSLPTIQLKGVFEE